MITSPLADLRAMAVALGADVADVPACPISPATGDGYDVAWADPQSLETWRATTSDGDRHPQVIVAVWPESHVNVPFLDVSAGDFAQRVEWPFAAWYAALGAAVARCADGGAIVAVVERPAPLDCAGWAAESGMADAVEAWVRSLARSEGPRGVRVNAVTSPSRLAPARVVAPTPPLADYPGTIEDDVTAAVAMLLGDGVHGVTGTVVHADCGRSWR
ncbi:MAG: hypothetical protein JWM34_1859 [Ilumatobacteraceae bacterium]|nr:hypothetical protein [Ilumatobacteraceae bacterium]